MNSVYEPCPNSDSEITLSLKTGCVHQVNILMAQLAHPSEHRRAQGRARGRVVAPLAGRVAGLQRCVAGPSRPCRGLRAQCREHRRRVTGAVPGRVAGFVGLYCDTAQPCLLLPGHNTPECIAIQCSLAQLLLVAIQLCVLQYNALPSLTLAPVTIHQVYCDTTSPALAASVTIQFVY